MERFPATLTAALRQGRLRPFWRAQAYTYLAQQAWQTALLWALAGLRPAPLWLALGVVSLNLPALAVGLCGPDRTRSHLSLARLGQIAALASCAAAGASLLLSAHAMAMGAVLVAASLVLATVTASQIPLLQADLAGGVDGQSLAAANAAMEFASRLGMLAGPVLAGLVLSRLGFGPTAAGVALAFAAAARAMSVWDARVQRRSPPVPAASPAAGLVRAMPYLRRDAFLALALAVRAVNNLVWPAITIGLPLLTVMRWHAGATGYGLVVAARAVGGVAGTALGARLDRRRLAIAYFLAWMVEGLGFLGLAVAPTLAPALALAALGGVAGPPVHIALDSHIGRCVPAPDRPSVFALQRLIISGCGLAGSLAVGLVLAVHTGAGAVSHAVAGSGAVVLATALGALVVARRAGVLAAPSADPSFDPDDEGLAPAP